MLGYNVPMLHEPILRRSFLQAISQSLADYHAFGPRSPKKLLAPHRWIAQTALARLGDGFRVSAYGVGEGKEKTVPGQYYDKTVDVAVEKVGDDNARVVAVASFKFVTSNYKQNSVNYFEHLLGETANLRRAEVGFAHLLVLRKDAPYLKKSGQRDRVEKITEHDMAKYIRLFRDRDFPHKPQVLGVALVDFADGDPRFCEDDPEFGFSPDTIAALRGDLSVERFADKFVRLCQFLA